MALIGNTFRVNRLLGRYTGTAPGFATFCSTKSGHFKSGFYRNWSTGIGANRQNEALPNGTGNSARGGNGWMLPQKSMTLASRNSATISIGAGGTLIGGRNGTGQAALSITAEGTGGLVATVTGSASFSISAAGDVSGALNCAGAAGFSITAAGDLGAIITATGNANFGFTAGGTLSGKGWVTGSAFLAGESVAVTPDNLAIAVWQAVASASNTAGSMGAKLNSAASGGVDYAAMSSAVRVELGAELLRIIELAKIHGLEQGTDLVVTPTSRVAGDVVQVISGDGTSSTTVSRP